MMVDRGIVVFRPGLKATLSCIHPRAPGVDRVRHKALMNVVDMLCVQTKKRLLSPGGDGREATGQLPVSSFGGINLTKF